jgi:hypothetical protein
MVLSPFRALAGFALALALTAPASASAQPSMTLDPAVSEDYIVEFGAFVWKPNPEMILRTETLNIVGTSIDLVEDLGMEKGNLPDFRFILRPIRKHKLRISHVPIHYSAESVLDRTIVFDGTVYRVGLPVISDFEWKAWRFGYEYDFIARDRGYVGVIFEAKYTDVKLDIASLALSETIEARAPIPAVGGTFRVYPAPFAAITGEITGIKLPGSLTDGDDSAEYLDWDLYATVNFTRNVAVQLGYRTLNVSYRFDEEFGDFEVRGVYFGAVARF